MTAREKALQTAKSMKGQRDSVIALYNTYRPLPRGYKVKDSDLACATFCSSVYIALGPKWTAIVPPECAAWRLYRNLEALGCTVWGNNYTPVMGDLMFFGVGSSVSKIDHVGIFERMDGDTYVFWDIRSVVEQHRYTPGTKSSIKAYGYILGWGTPDYASIDDYPDPEPAHEFVVGDLVTVNPGAKWYKGQTIKANVFDDKWYIMAVKGDRAVLGMNLSETRNIQSPIHTSDITLVVPDEPPADPGAEKVTISITIRKDSKELLDIMAQGNHMTYGELIDLWLEDAR